MAGGEPLDTPQDLARRLQVPVTTIYAWNSKGIGPPRVKVGRHVRYRRSDVEAWLAQHLRDVPPSAGYVA